MALVCDIPDLISATNASIYPIRLTQTSISFFVIIEYYFKIFKKAIDLFNDAGYIGSIAWRLQNEKY